MGTPVVENLMGTEILHQEDGRNKPPSTGYLRFDLSLLGGGSSHGSFRWVKQPWWFQWDGNVGASRPQT